MKILKIYKPEDLKEMSRYELENLLAEELKYLPDGKVAEMICKLREEFVKSQKDAIKEEMEAEVKVQLKNHEVLISKYSTEEQKQKAYAKIMKFLEDKSLIVHKEILSVIRSMLEYLYQQREGLQIKDIRDFDFLMRKHTEILGNLMRSDMSSVGFVSFSKYVDAMLELDAKYCLDKISEKHIKRAVDVKYGDLVRTDDPQSGKFYYYSADAYREAYQYMKEKYNVNSQEV